MFRSEVAEGSLIPFGRDCKRWAKDGSSLRALLLSLDNRRASSGIQAEFLIWTQQRVLSAIN